MKLYNFFRSGTSHRLRIALNLKGLDTQYIPVDLRTEQHLKDDFKAVNPQMLVPALATDDGKVLIQSPAIIEWLEETHPMPALLPTAPHERAHVRALAAIVGCDIHPSTTAAFWNTCATSSVPTRLPSMPGAAPGSAPVLTPTKHCWRKTHSAVASALAMRPALPMSIWCRRSRVRAASRWICRAGR